MPNKSKKGNNPTIRIKDIAEKAGVSIGTVDRVLHNRGEVSEKTKKKVLAIVKELNYQPNLLASSLALKKEIPFAVLIPKAHDDDSYWMKPLDGIQKAANEMAQYGIRIKYHFFDMMDKSTFTSAMEKALADNPRGILFSPYFTNESVKAAELLQEMEIPFVLIDSNLKQIDKLSYLGHDAQQSGYLAGRLLDLCTPKDQSVAILNFGKETENLSHLKRRKEGFLTYFEQNNPNRELHVLKSEDEDVEYLASLLTPVLRKDKMPLAGIFVPNSKIYRVATFIKQYEHEGIHLIGYDLISKNVEAIKGGLIDFLVCQRPEEQGYKGIYTLFEHVVARKEAIKENFTSIDIITRENIDYYRFL
ncbi:LacI family transcriptional regulator [Prolixibacteraceae bacterium JC049]|nr:LacI family transcriptional regulator [Prolixibacteraceae bacterium JC049]